MFARKHKHSVIAAAHLASLDAIDAKRARRSASALKAAATRRANAIKRAKERTEDAEASLTYAAQSQAERQISACRDI